MLFMVSTPTCFGIGVQSSRSLLKQRNTNLTTQSSFFIVVPRIFILSKFYYQLVYKRNALIGILKFTLKQLQHVSVLSPSSKSALFELAKVKVVKQSIKNTLLWLVGWCGCMQPHQPTNHSNVFLTDCFNNCDFTKFQ
jgi:hypothetical protein